MHFPSQTIGRFVLSPGAKPVAAGLFCGSLSIKRGRGSACNDSLYTFVPTFATREAAAAHALTQGFTLLGLEELHCPKKN